MEPSSIPLDRYKSGNFAKVLVPTGNGQPITKRHCSDPYIVFRQRGSLRLQHPFETSILAGNGKIAWQNHPRFDELIEHRAVCLRPPGTCHSEIQLAHRDDGNKDFGSTRQGVKNGAIVDSVTQ